MSEALEALERMIGIPASVGVCEPVEGFAKRPQDAVDCMREMAAEITRLRAALEQTSTGEAQARALYDELLYQVQEKIPGETRHQTALRQLKQANSPQDNGPAEAKRIREEG